MTRTLAGSFLTLTLTLTGCAPSAPPPAPEPQASQAATPAPSQAATTEEGEDGVDVRGAITRLTQGAEDPETLGRLLIEGGLKPDTKFDKALVRVTEATRLFREGERGREPARFADLAVGQQVEATFDGPVAKSYPPQATARQIVILRGDPPATGDAETPAPEPGDTAPESFEGTVGILDRPKPDAPVATLREVRTARQQGFDRVVFEFEGSQLPGYHLEYIDKPVRQCGSGDPTPIAGDAWLQVRMIPAQAHTEAGEATVQERERHLKYSNLLELESTCDFEAHVEWVLGVASPNRYRVLELTNPARLVVDVRH